MGIKVLTKNKRASYDYALSKKIEAGIMLVGTEVKSLREGKCNITESHVTIDAKGEVWVHNMYIPHYKFGNLNNHEERRTRKLLLNHKEIADLYHSLKAGGLTIVPTMLYFKDRTVKLEIALGKGKKNYDKRQDEAKKDVQRKLQRKEYDD